MTQIRRFARRNVKVSQNSVMGTARGTDIDSSCSATTPFDFTKTTAGEIMSAILELNKDPVLESMIHAYISKIPQEHAEIVESEKRARSLGLYGLPEPVDELSPSNKQRDLDDKRFREAKHDSGRTKPRERFDGKV
ncbi:hypothetical protein ANCDUO_12471 [Ancylostoma duodenale]|uniref:Uncharacterized protein n=1 Tax=Ancylostoma duodenale TaxID=51022 RepID=A0A0C2GEK6_9BILA|nr:hypothetical protein ANCDUO_12471 [Ancylostoma duodenale]